MLHSSLHKDTLQISNEADKYLFKDKYL